MRRTFLTARSRLLAAAGLLALGMAAPALAQTAPAAPALDRGTIEAIVKEYLLKHPEVIQEAMVELERRQKEEEQKAVKRITSDPKSPLYVSEHHAVVGNPNGDVTIVEFFDFNCGFCKRGLADMQKIIDTDKNVRIVLKEFPILSPGSRDAAIVALALRQQFDKDKQWRFHTQLLNTRGNIGKEQALAVAKELGADMKKLDVAMASPAIPMALEESRMLADALGISGTPSYVVAEELVVGARGYDELMKRVTAWRQCKKAEC